MALFGGEKRKAKNEALDAEVERVNALSLEDLAVETMTKGFGPGAPGAGGGAVLASDIGGAFVPGDSTFGLDQDDLVAINNIASEGIQVLEHAGLVRMIVASDDSHNSHTYVTMTRAGRAAVEGDSVKKALKTR
jgi:hypothetical protein